ncbi:MAG TPA: glycosyl hydrolase family 18 protein, partial [Terriglobia bacterium]|nr:glycosyl hydrolase family 18 protein [Terriglobia bacterium]
SKPGEAAPGQWAAAFDYRALGEAADFVTLMAYDNFGRDDPPGPIAGFDWVNRAVAFALSRIPASKILLGIPLYGREWTATRHGYSTRSLTFSDIDTLLVNHALAAKWDARGQAPWFRYRAGGSLRTVYFEDDRSLREKLGLVPEFHLRGFAAWRIGSESPSFWTLVRHADRHRVAPPSPAAFASSR